MTGPNLDIYRQAMQPVKSVQDYNDEASDRESRNVMRLLQQGALTDAQRARDESARFTRMFQGLPAGADDNTIADTMLRAGFPTQANAYRDQSGKRQELKARLDKETAQTESEKFKLTEERRKAGIAQIAAFKSPEDAVAALDLKIKNGDLPAELGELMKRSIPADAAQLPQWQLRMIASADNPAALRELLTPHMQTNNAGNAWTTTALDKTTGLPIPGAQSSVPINQSPDNKANNDRAMAEGAADRASRERQAAAALTQASQHFKISQASGKLHYDAERGGTVNLATGEFLPAKQGGVPIGPKKPSEAVQRVSDAKEALQLIDQADQLIGKATGSYGGVVVDAIPQVWGKSTPGADAAAQLKAIEGMLVSKMPKMSGPQSDKDVALYRQMAGMIGDATVPAEQKRAALKTVREIQERHAGSTNGGASGSWDGSPTTLMDGVAAELARRGVK